MAIFSIRNFAIKQLMKRGDDGIMKMPSNMKADFAEAMLTKQLIDAGIDPRLIKNEQQLVNILDGIDDMNRQLAEMATKESKKVTSNVVDMKGKKLDSSKPIMGGTQEGGLDNIFNEMYGDFQKDKLKYMSGKTTETEAEIAARMNKENKEAVERIKNKKMLDDAIEDASPGFANDIKYDAEIVAENLAERMGLVYDDLPTKQRIDLYDQAYKGLSKQRFKGMKKPDPEEKADGGRIGFFKGAVAGGGNISPGTDVKGNVRDDNPFTGGGGGGPKGPPSVISKSPKINPIVERLKKRNPPDDSFFKKFLAHDRFTDMMKTTNTPNYHQMGGLDFMARFPNMNPDTAKKLASAYQNVFEVGRAIADGPGGKTIGDALDTAKEEAALNAIGIDAFSDPTSEIYKQYTSDKFALKPAAVQMADGGRIGLKDGMDRRTFMKIMAGLATLPVVGKMFKGAKVASKVAPVAKVPFESAARSEAPTYFFELVKKIKLNGKKSKVGPSDRVDEYSYTGKNGDEYTLTEDIATGDAQITKDKIGGRSYEEGSYDVIEDRTVMEYKAPKQDVDVETQKTTNEAAEYEEYRVEFDQDGTEAGAEAMDEYIQKEIIEEAGEEATSIKKAEGGRIPFIFGGGIFKAVIKNLAKEKGISPSEYLNITNYRLLPDSAKRIMSKSEYLKLKEEMTGKRIEMVENVRDMIQSRLAFNKSKADLAASMNKASPGYGDQAVKMMFPEGSFKSPVPAGAGEKDIMMMEQLIKNLKLKGRKENASGGIARMLGE